MTRTTVQMFRDEGVTFLKMLVPCGRVNCRKCPHGPYWYARYWIGSKMRERYVGKSLTRWAETVGGVSAERLAALKEKEELLAESEVGDGDRD